MKYSKVILALNLLINSQMAFRLVTINLFLIIFDYSISFAKIQNIEGFIHEPSRKTACFITLNSHEERDVFYEMLDKREFQSVELAHCDQGNLYECMNNSLWFDSACKNVNLNCDILVLSGHFGGELFFGKSRNSGMRLWMNKLKDYSCERTCSGVLERPVKTYLFGCNVLASKVRDKRSDMEYLDALVHSGIDPSDAVRIVSKRYGPFGSSFGDEMRRIFGGGGQLLGFSGGAPDGRRLAPYIREYLEIISQKEKSYGKYIDRLKLLRDSFQKLNLFFEIKNYTKAIYDYYFDQIFHRTKYPYKQESALIYNQEEQEFKDNLCIIENDNIWYSERMELMSHIASNSNIIFYIPVFEDFFRRYPPYKYDKDNKELYLQYDFREIEAYKNLKNKISSIDGDLIRSYYHTLNDDIFKAQIGLLLWHLGVLQFNEFDSIVEKIKANHKSLSDEHRVKLGEFNWAYQLAGKKNP